ncbi:hypothetical protein MNBD_ALPHA12-857, partial [hydrothermal vent metagenome]
MQGLVYIFIAIIGLAIGVATYFALAFTPVEAALAALISIGLSLFFLERGLRRRAEDRLERMIQDLSRLLSTDAKAGQTLSARINELYDMEADKRLGVLEADVSVLGTVLRQLAETMAEMEDAQARLDNQQGAAGAPPVAEGLNVVEPARDIEPVIPLEMLRKALDDERLIHHIEPIITLPQRRVHGYDLVPRLMLEDGELAMPADFMPVSGGNELISQIEALALHDAITIARRTRTAGEPVVIYVPLSLATLHNAQGCDQIVALLDANRAITGLIQFLLPEQQWSELGAMDKKTMARLADNGAGFSLSSARSLRMNFSEMFNQGVRSIRADCKKFIDKPSVYTDFHTADISSYVNRFDIDLIMTGVAREQHVLTLLDDGIT